ncbi:MAG: hypothetical protein L6R40_004080 [Gallowayella cf. fulva]|nr:MAG: hypothetical protein L6R40_004080 [Xanthomendoza cf. fulva]
MRFTSLTLILFPLLVLVSASPVAKRNGQPQITIVNNEPRTVCLQVETGADSPSRDPPTTKCDGIDGISVPAGQTTVFRPGPLWHGAITPYTRTGARGTRFELNFQPDVTWYDADMELGMSGATLGPSDKQPAIDGRPSLVGELDPLAKANAAWAREKDWGYKAVLWQFPQYISVSEDKSRLTYVYMDKGAPDVVRIFFQLTAAFNAYVYKGSVAQDGNPNAKVHVEGVYAEMERAADDQTRKVDNKDDMTITIFRWG